MEIDIRKIKTQDETEEPAAIDEANKRVEATMKAIEQETKEQVSEGLNDDVSSRPNETYDKETG